MARPIELAALAALELAPPDLVSCAARAGYDHVGLPQTMPALERARRLLDKRRHLLETIA